MILSPTQRAAAEAIVTSHGWMSEQPKRFQAEALRRARVVDFPAGAPAFVTGDETGGIYGIVRGSFGIYVPDLTGQERLAHIARTGTWFGHPIVSEGRGRSLTIYAAEPSRTLHVGLSAMSELAASLPDAVHSFNNLTRAAMRIAIEVIADQLIPDSDCRIAATLLRLAGLNGDIPATGSESVFLTQAQLAEMTNMSRHRVNSALARFKGKGWIDVSYNRVAIADAGKLRAFLGRKG